LGAEPQIQKSLKLTINRYRAITSAYYKAAQGAILVYDITKIETFKNMEPWLKEVRQYAEAGVSVILLGK
jgi:GTPase SAR1 family protein